jgi:hypothetical protein
VTIDVHTIMTLLLGGVCGLLGWLGRELWSAVQKLRDDLAKLEVKLGSDYVRYDRLQDVMKPVMTKLERIEDALMHKVDKP